MQIDLANRQPEVGDIDPSLRIEQQVCRLDVAMHHLLLRAMGVIESFGDVDDQLHRLGVGKGRLLESLGERAAVDELRHQEPGDFGSLSHLVDRNDVGMF